MSIVEKAMAKLHARNEAAAAVSTVESQRRMPPSTTVAAAHVQLPPAGRLPGQANPVVTLDIEALRRSGLLPPAEGAAQIQDQFRRLKWPLLRAAWGKDVAPVSLGNVIAVVSAVPAEGKTFVTTNLALSLAQEHDCAAVVVDADVRKRGVTKLLGLTGRPGLIDIGTSTAFSLDDVVVRTSIPGLAVLPAGTPREDVPEIFGSHRVEQVIAEMSARWPQCIWLFDSAPLLATPEAQLLARNVGQVLMVVRADYTPAPAVNEAISLLDRRKAISCVLNHAVTGVGSESYYNHYYGGDGVDERKARD
jgi:exopolysaccharide/PEP-CTERM locus tyrosine autokinase